ncbi:MAG: prolipoprotein diacylglyceryl transferase [Desulfobacterales bacterium]|nr:prolipoprotein diacylglyceryl transferase [Desulfobacterales bacterium]
MYPVLLKIGKLPIYTYGLFIATGFMVGMYVARKEAERLGQDPYKIMDICFYILLFGIIGSRVFFILTTPGSYLADPLEIFKIWKGGLVFYGGFIGAVAAAFIFLKKNKMPFWKTTDILAPGLAIGHFFGRIGCFFAGCCYGKPCDLPWAIVFRHPESVAYTGVPLHPTQIYSAINNLAIFGLLWLFRTRKKFDGQLFCIYVFIYGITRSIIETFRGDFRGDTFFGILSVSQTIGISMSLIAVYMIMFLGNKNQTKVKK